MMNLTYKHDWLEDLATNPELKTAFNKAVVRAYRLLVTRIVAATDERDLRRIAGYEFKEGKGKRKGTYTMRLNDQFRVRFTITPGTPKNTINIIDVGDFHDK